MTHDAADLLSRTLRHLTVLVGFDTRNPPRAMSVESAIFDYLRQTLEAAGLQVELIDEGQGCISVYGRRGQPHVLWNCHVDTVPAADTWAQDPLSLRVEQDRAVGLGACDIKGAAACMLAAIEVSAGPVAVLFSSDEEAGQSVCVRRFAARGLPFKAVLVAEPTQCQAVVEHRGILTYTGEFRGQAGHAAQARALEDSATHQATRWAASAWAMAQAAEQAEANQVLGGMRFNLGRIEGGTKNNMIATHAVVTFGLRPSPAHHPEQLGQQVCALAPEPTSVQWTRGFYGPTLPAPSAEGKPGLARAAIARKIAVDLGLSPGSAVDFWTEASIFSQAGYHAIVFGPGDIAQAHTAQEWIALSQLERAALIYTSLLDRA